jgi:group I intron endonuclease
MKFFKKEIPVELNNASGVYKITNEINGKVYIGKTVNFRKRYGTYKAGYKRQDVRAINEYFLNSINKYGAENFTFSIVEVCDPTLASDRELYWMQEFCSLDPKRGYNLRFDSSTGLIVDVRTRDKISRRVKKEFEEGKRTAEQTSQFFSDFWKNNPCVKEGMKLAVSAANCSFFLQKTMEGEPITLWKGINQIIENNQEYKFQNIYAACNGSKKSYRGYKWERFDSLPVEYEHLLSDLPFSYGNARFKQEKSEFEQKNGSFKVSFIYKVYCKGQKFVVLYRGLGALASVALCAFSKSKQNEAVVKGFQVKRERFDTTIADFEFLESEALRLKSFIENSSEETVDVVE